MIAELLENKYPHTPSIPPSTDVSQFRGTYPDRTLNNWVMHVGEGLLHTYPALWKAIVGSRYLQVDETPIKLLRPD